MSYIGLRGRWYNVVVFNVHAPSEEKSDDLKGGFYEALEEVFDHFTKYDLKILLAILMQNWRKNIFSNRQLGMRI